MNWRDQRVLFTALGFMGVVMKDGNSEAADLDYRARGLATLIESFCRNNTQAGTVTTDMDSAMSVESIDQIIDHHVREMRMCDETSLPEGRETLLRLYDRLQHRAIRREQAAFYAKAHTDMLAERIMTYLNAEVADRKDQEHHAAEHNNGTQGRKVSA